MGLRPNKRLAAWQCVMVWLLAFALLPAACRQQSSETTTPLPTPTAQAAAEAPALPSLTPQLPAPEPSPTALPTASPTPASSPTPLPLISSPCGVSLPVLPASIPPTTTSLNRNQTLDDIPEAARAAVRYILENPQNVALAAYRVGQEQYGIYLNADVPMPLASVTKVIPLVAYAEAVNNGILAPTEWILLSELEKFYLPGADLNAHTYALEDAASRDLIAHDPPQTPLEELPWMMTQHSSNAAADYLHQRLGQTAIEATAQKLGLASQTAPCPFIGQFLIMANHLRTEDDGTAIERYLADAGSYSLDVMRLTDAFSLDEAFRQAEIRWRRQTRRPSIQNQRLFSAALGAQGTARDYAHLMSLIAQNQLETSYINILVRRYLEWPMIFAVNQEQFWTMGYKGGSLPGILTGVYYGEPLAYRTPVVVALFVRDLPMSTYRQWRQDWPHDELARWLMYDINALPTLGSLLQTENK